MNRPPLLHIHHSNRLERLRDALLRQLHDSAAADPFVADEVIVPHAAMRRHLSLAIADARGVCANLRFGYLAQWLWQQIAQAVPGVADESPFAADTLVWRAHRAFTDAAFVAAQPRLQSYLAGADALMHYELACEVAALFEQYLIYRPDWLQGWADAQAAAEPSLNASPDAAWQATLWRRIDAEIEPRASHPARAFVTALRQGAGQPPACVHVFALPQIAPQHLQLLQEIARRSEVHVYVCNPCREYWFDLIDRRRLAYLAARGRSVAHAEEGNRLLAAWGKQAQAHIEALVEAGGDNADDDAHFEPSAGRTLLAQVQDALLDLRAIEPGSLQMAQGDRSIELHVCHSLTRELEVLHDRLLGLFAADPALLPGEVLVVMPDPDGAAPLIDAVFGAGFGAVFGAGFGAGSGAAGADRALPYALCGTARSSADAPTRCLLQLLALAGSRCSASDVFALLQQPPVARRFGLDDDALAQVHDWLLDAGFHWALDATQREGLQLPATAAHTLDDALQRLFLGYALPGRCGEPFAGLLGAGDAHGTRAGALGALWRYAQALRQAIDALRRPHAPAQCAALLGGLLDTFIAAADDELEALHALRQHLHALADQMRRGGVDDALPLAVVRAALQRRLEAGAAGGAAGGSINFAGMSTLRGLPFKVVCAIGLNDGDFPATRRALEFDLIARAPRRGDRERRQDDRAVMLDLLLAARGHLHLSHTGRSVRDNAPLPPSVLVAELLDLLLPAIAADGVDSETITDAAALRTARAKLVIEHPLQPFATAAFDTLGDARLRSHDHELAAALRAKESAAALRTSVAGPVAAGSGADAGVDGDFDTDFDTDPEDDDAAPPQPGAPFFTAPLPPAAAPWRQVELAQLITFLRNPCRVLLRRRLGIALERDADELSDDEAFVPDRRARRALSRRLLPRLLSGADERDLLALARADGAWPDGGLGQAELQLELQALQAFAARLRPLLQEPTLPPLTWALDLPLAGETWQLQASFGDLRSSGLLRWRDDEARVDDCLDTWLWHLALCAAAPAGIEPRTRWLGRHGGFEFEACADAAAQLQRLVALYRRGLEAPLHFYPRSAWSWLDKGASAARGTWQPTVYRPYAEGADAAYRLALRGVEQPLDGEFERLAAEVFEPLLRHLREDVE